jgi:cyclopropane-fatty-acyl-phospholipid synthase
MTFRKQNLMNFQIQITKRQGVALMTRDYIGHEEKKVLAVERGKRSRPQITGEPFDEKPNLESVKR